MLRKAKDLRNYSLGARDGEIGRVKDVYFDDQSWTVRYLVADTGKWLPGRKVLISPYAIRRVEPPPREQVAVDLTKEQIEKSPSIDADKTVSRQFELKYYSYYNWPYYWQGPMLWGPGPVPGAFDPGMVPTQQTPSMPDSSGDPHLRSVEEISGYHLHARDGELGHIEDVLIDEANWTIRYLEVDTRNWLPGKKVLASPEWITSISWRDSMVHFDLDRETIRSAPEYDHATPITREYEMKLFNHYNREPYWMHRIAA